MKVSINHMGKALICLVIITTFFRGFIRNFFGIGTILVDLMFVLCLFLAAYVEIRKKIYFNKIQLYYFFWVFICIGCYLLQCLFDKTDIYTGFLGIRNDVIYTSLFICVYVFLDTSDIKSLYKFVENTGTIICAFAIIQYFGRNILPNILLDASDAETYWYYDANAIRVNGLVGNTIIFGAFTVIIAAIVWADLLSVKYKSVSLWIKMIICVMACYFTFGRASFVGLLIAVTVEWLFNVGLSNFAKNIKRYFKFIIVATIIAVILFVGFRDSIVITRILDRNSSMNVGSDYGHALVINNAIDVISKNWFLGYGLDKAGYSISNMNYFIIGDGTLWTALLQWGVFPVIVFLILVVLTIKKAVMLCKGDMTIKKKVALVYLGINAYLLPASFINSAYDARICIILTWLFAGFMYVKERQEQVR